MTSRWLLLLTFAFLAASWIVDILFLVGNHLGDLPVIGSALISHFIWIYLPMLIFTEGGGVEGFDWTGAGVAGAILAVIALWDLRKKRVHWSTALAMVLIGATLAGFITEWSNFIVD